jgi:hypothetical protein
MIGDGTIIGGAVHHNAVLSRSSVTDADIRAGTVLIDSHVAGVTVAQATLIGVRVSGNGSIRGRLVIRPYEQCPDAYSEGVQISDRCVLEGVEVFGEGSIRGQVWIEPVDKQTEQAE